MSSKWGVDASSSRLFLENESSGRAYPSAAEIFKIVFERTSGRDQEAFEEIRKSLPNLEFRPTLAFLVLEVSITPDGFPNLMLRLNARDTYLAEIPTNDQVVIGNVWYPLDPETRDEMIDALESRNLNVGSNISAQDVAWLVWESQLTVDISGDAEELSSGLLKATKAEFRKSLLNAELYDYQKSGAAFVDSMVDKGIGVLLADEMGLGKTIQAIYAIQSAANRESRPIIAVVPASNLANWIREFGKFAPSLDISVHAGPLRAGAARYLVYGDVLLTTYQTLLRDVSFLAEVNWSLVVLDEAQNIKNSESKQSLAACLLPKRSAIAITGTPIENSLSDLWSIFRFLQPNLLGSKDEFRSRFPDTFEAAASLSKSISPFVVRRKVREVADDLPERSDIYVPIFLSAPMNSAYSEIQDDAGLSSLPKVNALRQICAVPKVHQYESNKVDRLLELLRETFDNGDKAIVFASFTETIDLLVQRISQMRPGILVETLDGRKSASERQQVIDSLDHVKGAAVLVANPRAAGVGLNIQVANYVFHFNPEWNPALIAQASARAYRRGQIKNVFIYYLYYRGTVEEYVLQKLEAKQGLQDAGLGELSDEPTNSQLLEALRLSPKALQESGTWSS